MTFFRAAFKAMSRAMFPAMLCAAAFAAAPAEATSFKARRGLNLDQWVTWPQPPRWGDPAAMLPFPEWRRSLDAAGLRRLKDAGFDFLRMPVDPSPFLSDQGAPLRERLFDEILTSVQLINEAGLKVIVDMHMIAREDAIGMGQVMGDSARFDAYAALVREMARLLSKEDPAQVALELMNEPGSDCAEPSDWAERQKKLFAAARASATRLSLVLTGGCLSNAGSLARIDPRDYPDDNLLWTFHSYEPFVLTHQGATWAGDFVPYVTGLPYPLASVPRAELDSAIERIRARIRKEAPIARRSGLLSYLDEQIAEIDTPAKLAAAIEAPFGTVSAWAKENGIDPGDILLGEFGMIRQEYGKEYIVPGPVRAAFYRDTIERAEAHGFMWSMWSYGGAFGVVEAFDGKKAEPDVVEIMKSIR